MIASRAFRVALMAGIVLAVNTGLTRAYRWAEAPASWTLATDRQLRARPSLDLEWLVMGDSHAKCGIDARLMPDAFNLATLGSHYYHTYYRLRHFLEREGGTAAFLILPLDTHSVAWQRGRIEDAAYWGQYLDYGQLAWRTGRVTEYARRYLTEAWVPYAGRGDRIVEAVLGRGAAETRFPLVEGHVQMPGDWSETPLEARLRLTATRCAFVHNGYAPPDAVMVAYIRDTLALCAAHGIQPVMVRFPLTGEAWAEIDRHLDIAAIDALFDELIAPYPDAIRLDFGYALADDLHLFNDPDHLNAEGAQVFTRLLVERLQAEGLIP